MSGSGLHYTKSGALDMRYSSSREAASSYSSTPSYSSYSAGGGASSGSSSYNSSSYSSTPSYSANTSSSNDLHYKKDGSLDMRYTSSKQAPSSSSSIGSKPAQSSYSPGDALHYKKDGTPDMRYTSSKAQGSSSGSDLHYKKDGTPDMRYSTSKLAPKLGQMKLNPDAAGIPDSIPRKKDGMPDMRTKLANDWVTAEASKCSNTNLPSYVPLKKDGSIDMSTAIGRAFAKALPPHTNYPEANFDFREEYYLKRLLDENFQAMVQQQRDQYVPPPVPQPIQPIQMPRESDFGAELSSVVPDTVPQIEYTALIFIKSDEDDGVIGRGAFGVVLKAEWHGLNVAVKKLHLDQLTKKEKDSFRKELVILANLGTHRNLVKLHGYCIRPPCIVMELVSLGSLTNLLHYCEDPAIEAKMTDGRIKKNIVFGVADGMRQLHAAKIVHGDVKPQNVLINDDYEPKITDFGLSALRGKTSSSVASKKLESDDEPYDIGGTAGYMAPELLGSTSPPDFPSDIYSFGVVLNEVIIEEEPYSDQYANFAGRGPFGAANYAKLGKRPTVSKKTPKPVEDLIRRCWNADATIRPTFSEILVIIGKENFKIPNSVEM